MLASLGPTRVWMICRLIAGALAAMLLLAVSPSLAPAAIPSGTWQPLGPAPIGPPYFDGAGYYGGVNTGRVTAIAVIPSGSHAGRVVLGSASGGIWTTDNRGTTWTPRTDNAPDLAIGAVAVDPSDPNHLVAGTGEANLTGDAYPGQGLLVSSDGGTTWTPQDPGGVFYDLDIAQVAIDPHNPSHEFAATSQGLYETTNAGASWALPSDPSYNAVAGAITAVVLDPSTNPSTVYIGGGAATVAKSTDGGATWSPAHSGITASGDFTALAIAPSSPSTLYVSVGSEFARVALYRTTNAAGGWTRVTQAPDYTGTGTAGFTPGGEQGNYDNVLAVDPTNPNHVLAGGIQLVETHNGLTGWTSPNGQISFNAGSTNHLHPDNHALFFAPDGTVWIGDDGGVYHYNPTSHHVTNANGNLDITQVRYGLSVVDGTILGGSQDNATFESSRPTLSRWTGISGGDGGPSAITPNDPSLQFTSSDGDLFATTDAWHLSVIDITPTVTRLFVPPILVVPNRTDPAAPTLFYGGENVWRTTDPADFAPKWSQVTSIGTGCGFFETCVSALAAAPSDPNVVYAGFATGQIEVSTDGGQTFSLARKPTTPESFVTGISVDPANPQAITVSFSSDTTRTTIDLPHIQQYSWNGLPKTGHWTRIGGTGLPDAVSRVIYYRQDLVAATDSGVYATSAPSGTSTVWTRVGHGLPNVQTQDLVGTPGGLYAATFGRGVWLLPSGAPLNLHVPALTGTAIAGQRLTETHGLWTGSPTSYAYQWLRCAAAGYGCLAIPGATARSYLITQADDGHRIRVQETARNAHGPGTGPPSAGSAVVQAPVAPAISAVTHDARSVGRSSATLRGVINATGAAVRWQFQFGHTRPYLHRSPLRSVTAVHGKLVVTWRLTGLRPGTVYHFRLLVMTPPGLYRSKVTSRGADLTVQNGQLNPQPASAGSSAPSLISVSASSADGSEPRTMPQPAYSRAVGPRSRAHRSATQNSPSPVASVQPIAPAYQPRSRPSSAGISSSARVRGWPPTAGVG